jgi:hypothetical protein
MIFRIYHETAGGHVHCRVFAGRHDGALGKCGDLCMRVEEFEVFKSGATFVQFLEEVREPLPAPAQSVRLTDSKPYGEILDEMDHEAKYLPAENLLQEIIVTMRHARVFITSREKMHPTGIQQYDELLEKLIVRTPPQRAAVTDGTYKEGDVLSYEIDEVTKVGRVTAHTRSAVPEIDPADLWEQYCAETPNKRRSPQGAMAFAVDALSRPQSNDIEKIEERQ